MKHILILLSMFYITFNECRDSFDFYRKQKLHLNSFQVIILLNIYIKAVFVIIGKSRYHCQKRANVYIAPYCARMMFF